MASRKYKYDIAISVAEEDIHFSELLAKWLKKKGIRYYLYTEHPEDAGRSLEDILVNVYGNESQMVVVLWSRTYRTKYWALKEREIAASLNKRKVLIRLDATPLEYDDDQYVYRKWEEGPARLANTLCRIIYPHRTRSRILKVAFISVTSISAVLFLWPSEVTSDRVIIAVPAPAASYSGLSTKYKIAISKKEITVAQFSAFCSDSNTGFKMPLQPSHKYGHNCPVVNITFEQARAYCKWVGGRLPTASEWEYAALGGENYGYSGSNNANDVAIYGSDHIKPSQVGLREPNGYGLFDMTGNAAEWCLPVKGDSLAPVRGGAYLHTSKELKIVHQIYQHKDSARTWIGFRVVWDVK